MAINKKEFSSDFNKKTQINDNDKLLITDGNTGLPYYTTIEEIREITKDGEDGKDGYTPIKGVDYFDGANGVTTENYNPLVAYSVGSQIYYGNGIYEIISLTLAGETPSTHPNKFVLVFNAGIDDLNKNDDFRLLKNNNHDVEELNIDWVNNVVPTQYFLEKTITIEKSGRYELHLIADPNQITAIITKEGVSTNLISPTSNLPTDERNLSIVFFDANVGDILFLRRLHAVPYCILTRQGVKGDPIFLTPADIEVEGGVVGYRNLTAEPKKTYGAEVFTIFGAYDNRGPHFESAWVEYRTTDFIPLEKGYVVDVENYTYNKDVVGGINVFKKVGNDYHWLKTVRLPSQEVVTKVSYKAEENDIFIRSTTADGKTASITIYYENRVLKESDPILNKDDLVVVGNSLSSPAPRSLMIINFLTNDAIPTTKGPKISGEVIINIDGFAFKKFAKASVQGTSSAVFPKKNLTFELFNDSEFTSKFYWKIDGIVGHSEFVYKANYIDATHSRNITSNQLWAQIVKSRDYVPKKEVENVFQGKTNYQSYDTGALGHVMGWCCEVQTNGFFYGIGCWNIGKKRENYNLDKTNFKHIQFSAENTATQLTGFGYQDIELRNPSIAGYESQQPINNSGVMADLTRLMNFNNSAQTNFKTNFESYWHKGNVIDFYLLVQYLMLVDVVSKNWLCHTYDGLKWFIMPYDLDMTYGLHWSGNNLEYPINWNMNTNLFFGKVYTAFTPEIEARYKYLRDSKIFSVSNIYDLFKKMEVTFGQDKYKQDFEKWGIPSQNITNLQQITNYAKLRTDFLDGLFNYN